MNIDEIKAEIAAGNIGAITLDTSAFGNPSEMTLEHGLVGRLGQFRGTEVRLVFSDVVLNELESHLAKGAANALAQFERSLKTIGGAWNIPRELRADAKKSLLGNAEPRVQANRRIQTFIDENGVVVAKAEDYANIKELMRRYFSVEPPFSEKEAKKNEFPDAIAVTSLDAWAEKEGTKILVVTSDGDWLDYCQSSPRLIAIRELSAALALLNTNGELACRALSKRLRTEKNNEWVALIERAVERHVDSMLFIPDADSQFSFDDEVVEVSVKNIDIAGADDAFQPVEMSDDSLVAEITVEAEVEVVFEFSFWMKDTIDKDYVSMGGTTSRVSKLMTFNVLVTFDSIIPETAEIIDIEPEKNRIHVFVGTVSPDWMSDPDYYYDQE